MGTPIVIKINYIEITQEGCKIGFSVEWNCQTWNDNSYFTLLHELKEEN